MTDEFAEGYYKARDVIIERELNHRCLNCSKTLKKKIMNNEIHIHLCERCRFDKLKEMSERITFKLKEKKE